MTTLTPFEEYVILAEKPITHRMEDIDILTFSRPFDSAAHDSQSYGPLCVCRTAETFSMIIDLPSSSEFICIRLFDILNIL